MNRTKIDSANIASIGYDKDSLTLEIEFLDGAVYQYFDIEEEIFNAFFQSNSKSKFFAEKIKGNYRYSRI